MGNLFICETFINVDKRAQFGRTGWHETNYVDTGGLYRHLRQEYGKATTMYADLMNGKSRKIGWVFSKRMRYEDARDPKDIYTREVWVEVSTVKPENEPGRFQNPKSPWERGS